MEGCNLFEKEYHASGPNNELIMMVLTSVGQNCYFQWCLNLPEIEGIYLWVLNFCFDGMDKACILLILHPKVAESCLWPYYEPSKVTQLKRMYLG